MKSGQVEVDMSRFTWKLEGFSELGKNPGDLIVSPIFQMGGQNIFHWKLRLYPFGNSESTKDFVSLFLKSTTCYMKSVKVHFKIVLSDVSGAEIKSMKDIDQFVFKAPSRGWSSFIKRDTLLKKIKAQDDTLNVTCFIHMDMHTAEQADVQTKILKDYETLFFNENFSDLTIIIEESQMKVHKSIMSARSKVFQTMLCNNMKENTTSTIEITDVSYNIMKEVLLFIYSGKLNDLDKDAKALLPVADKYEIKDLKLLCEKSMSMNVKIEDACEIFSMADLYKCSDLRARIIEFIILNIKDIKETLAFKKFIRANPESFEEIFSKVVEKNC